MDLGKKKQLAVAVTDADAEEPAGMKRQERLNRLKAAPCGIRPRVEKRKHPTATVLRVQRQKEHGSRAAAEEPEKMSGAHSSDEKEREHDAGDEHRCA